MRILNSNRKWKLKRLEEIKKLQYVNEKDVQHYEMKLIIIHKNIRNPLIIGGENILRGGPGIRG